jgi:glucokinase
MYNTKYKTRIWRITLENKYVIGIDAGGTKVAYGLFNDKGEIVDRFQHPTDIKADGPAFSDGVLRTVDEMLKRNGIEIGSLAGVGICMPSFILFDEGYVCMTSAMTNIKEFAMRSYLEERLPVQIVLDNDSNVAALAEHKHGAGRGSKHMVYMATSTGIGSGIIINEKLFRGSYGWAGECGHMLITPDEGILCGCGNQGCFMSYASGRYIPQHVKACMLQGTTSALSECENLDCTNILDAYQANDPLAIQAVEDMAHYIAVCAFNIYQMLNINLFVFGGGLVNFGEALFGRIRAEFDRYNHIPQPVNFRFAELEKDFGIIGAAELIFDK